MKRTALLMLAALVFAGGLLVSVRSVHAETDPVGWWKFDETQAGVNAVDSIGSNDAVPTGSPQPSTDVPDVHFTDTGSMSFSGSNYFTINRPVQDNFTICAWIKTTSVGGGTNHWQSAPIMDSEVSGLANDFGFGIGNGGKLMFGNGGSYDSQVNGTTTINDDTWHNVCVTRNGTTGAVSLYVDSNLDNTGVTSPGTLNSNPNARIGYGYDGAAHYVGLIDDVRVYDTDLDQSQLANITAGSSDPDTPPDTTPPVISNIAVSSITNSSATVTWTTDELASSAVNVGIASGIGSNTAVTDTSPRVTSHSVVLTSGNACTVYHYEVVSADASANTATYSDQIFTTTGCTASATPSAATSTSVTLNTVATSTLTDSSHTLTVTTPSNFATTSSVVIQIKGMDSNTVLGSIGKPSGGLTSAASIVFDVTAIINNSTVLDSFASPVTISYTYTDADVSGLDPGSLAMYHYHDGAWLKLDDCSVNTGSKTITCDAPSFSVFGIFGTPLISTTAGQLTASAGSVVYGCTDPSASNYQPSALVANTPALCRYALAAAPVPTTTLCPSSTFTRDLHLGDTGHDVQALQKFLNCNGFSLAASGPGSPGNETIFFSRRTQASVTKFQAANHITPTAGYFGPITREKAYGYMQ